MVEDVLPDVAYAPLVFTIPKILRRAFLFDPRLYATSVARHTASSAKPSRDDPERCEKCGGTMKIVSALSAPEQDDVIRALLESTGQWDPPWNRRAPPPDRTHVDAQGSHSSEPTVELVYEVDPDRLWPED